MELKADKKLIALLGLGATLPAFAAFQTFFAKQGPQISDGSLVVRTELRSSYLQVKTLQTSEGTYTFNSRPSVLTSFVSSYTISPSGDCVLFAQVYPKERLPNEKTSEEKLGIKFSIWNTQSGKVIESKFPVSDEPTSYSKKDAELAFEKEREAIVDYSIIGNLELSKFAIVTTRIPTKPKEEGDITSLGTDPVTVWGISLQTGQLFKLGKAYRGDSILSSPTGEDGYIFSITRQGNGSSSIPVTYVSYFSMQSGISSSPTPVTGLVDPRGWDTDGSIVGYFQEAETGKEGWFSVNPKNNNFEERKEIKPLEPKRFSSPLTVETLEGNAFLKEASEEGVKNRLPLPGDIKNGSFIPLKKENKGALLLIKEDGTAVVYGVSRS